VMVSPRCFCFLKWRWNHRHRHSISSRPTCTWGIASLRKSTDFTTEDTSQRELLDLAGMMTSPTQMTSVIFRSEVGCPQRARKQ
jgi:hypothetical protein